jgi:hypothetical protein
MPEEPSHVGPPEDDIGHPANTEQNPRNEGEVLLRNRDRDDAGGHHDREQRGMERG